MMESIPQVMVGFPGHAELTLIPWIFFLGSPSEIWFVDVCFSVFFLRIDAKSDVSLNLFGGLGTWIIFPYGNVIIPTDFHSIIFRGVGLNHQPEMFVAFCQILDLSLGCPHLRRGNELWDLQRSRQWASYEEFPRKFMQDGFTRLNSWKEVHHGREYIRL